MAAAARAQQTTQQVSLVAGTATDVRGITSRAVTVAPVVTVTPDPRVQLGVSASATRFDNDQWSLGGGANATSRASLGRFAAVSMSGGLDATTTSYKVSFLTAQATPALEGTLGPVTAFAGAHASGASTSITSTRTITPGPFGGPVPAPETTSRVTRSTIAPVVGVNVRATSDAGETILLGARQEIGRVEGVTATDRSVFASMWQGPISISAAAGVRREGGATSAFGSGALSLGLTPSVALEIAAGSFLPDRLTGAPAGRSVSIGLSLRSANRDPRLPAPAGVGAPAAGMTRLSIRSEGATGVALAGDFTNWKPVPAQRAPNGVWYVDLRIPPGQYRYAFRVDDKEWKVPEGAAASDDDFGGKSAWLVVATPGSTTRP